jgi:hypothetical protein
VTRIAQVSGQSCGQAAWTVVTGAVAAGSAFGMKRYSHRALHPGFAGEMSAAAASAADVAACGTGFFRSHSGAMGSVPL